MGMPNTWGTHIELFATAAYYQVPVYTYVVDSTNLRWEVSAIICQILNIYATQSLQLG